MRPDRHALLNMRSFCALILCKESIMKLGLNYSLPKLLTTNVFYLFLLSSLFCYGYILITNVETNV
jgi:hypothetical protein